MIRFTTISQAANGTVPQAIAAAKKMAAHASEVIGHDIQVFVQIDGPNLIHWVVDYEDMAAWAAARATIGANEDQRAIVAEGSEFFVEGSSRVTITELV